MRPPAADDFDNLRLVGIRIRERVLASDIGEDGDHVLADFGIEIGKVGEVETAMHISIPPCEQEIGDAAALAGIAVRDVEQRFEREADAIFHGKRPLRSVEWPRFGGFAGAVNLPSIRVTYRWLEH